MINSSIVSKDAMNSFNKLSPLAVMHPPPPPEKNILKKARLSLIRVNWHLTNINRYYLVLSVYSV